MLNIREGIDSTLALTLQELSNGPNEETKNGQGVEVEGDDVVELRIENKKLNYRITHLLRAIEEIEGE